MTEHISRLLDDQPLNSVLAVQREVSEARVAAMVSPHVDHAAAVLQRRCELWSGASHLLIPTVGGRLADAVGWKRLLDEADPDHFDTSGLAVEDLPRLPRSMVPFPESLVVVLASLLGRDRVFRPVHAPKLEPEDPCYLASLAIVGTLPDGPPYKTDRYHGLREDIRYDELLTVERPKIVGNALDLWQRVAERSTTMPTNLTLIGLTVRAASYEFRMSRVVLPSDKSPSSRFGPHVVVPYVPGSVEDLCLTWCVRAASGWPHDMPLAVPASEDAPAIIKHWETLGAGKYARRKGVTAQKALVSASIPSDQLRAWADQLGDAWTVASMEDVLRSGPIPARTSTEVLPFKSGRALVRGWSQDDVAFLGHNYSRREGLETRARFRPLSMMLPPSKSLASDLFMNGMWRGGCYETPVGDVSTLHEMAWPVGWTVLEAVARDRGLTVRKSAAGRAAEAFVHRIGSLDDTFLLSSPSVLALLYGLGERTGITYFRRKFNDIVTELRESGDLAQRADVIDAHLSGISASTSDAELHWITHDQARGLGSRREVGRWLEWAESVGVLLRGVEVDCARCGNKQWNALAELAPPVVCRGCAQPIDRPFRHDQAVFRYRASETLLRVLETDALGHILTLRWFDALFHTGFDKPETLYGGHPGVEVIAADGQVIGEADTLLLFTDGSIAVGEYKRSAAGLNDNELAKLDRVADAFDATWTFVATHDLARNCTGIWRDCQRSLPDRPHFALSGDRLYGHAIWTLGSNPFEWPRKGDESETVHSPHPGQVAVTLDDYQRPDASIHLAWKLEGRRSDETS